ncbi:glycogen/starch/alpha-glucan phosphorylase [Roseospira marina]|uniref:Alpha-1,4 glucan phosphorylase n=1 Tax=Roseospira marina TaxID=140057 RepID=A0A5M6IGJ0_9PROT|nr:glycogen/starch/alpha-glucan phosphorylase [Roseospira marina]KAA5606698.1 glycogen/starch/alpha-glucan phosphorylase [Roseospira marina]MBB4313889.1 starch phosphorylase [Roseospira marina]MBB5087051.1 starch phosphorylase [Roseospira marina]
MVDSGSVGAATAVSGSVLDGRGPKAKGSEVDALKRRLHRHLRHSLGKGPVGSTTLDWYMALALSTRDLMVETWMDSSHRAYANDAKRVYYLSMEFLVGRSLTASLLATGSLDLARQTLTEMGLDFDAVCDQEPEAALGNGGLGRLAACLMESMATLGIPARGYGIYYDYGMFSQYIDAGQQVEMPERWLRYGNVWAFNRPEVLTPVRFYGRTEDGLDLRGRRVRRWLDGEEVLAEAHDLLVPGHGCWTVNAIRLWSAQASRAFDLRRFNQGDYINAVAEQSQSESLSHVLYPDDSTGMGKALRLKQEYFFVAASLADIVRRFRTAHDDFTKFPQKVAIQLNDTHPALAVPELMRLLMDEHGLAWDEAWSICHGTFSYTNHTLLPEALETWPVDLIGSMLPRHMEIIYAINHQFLEGVRKSAPKPDDACVARLSMIDEGGERRVRMAHLAFVGSHRVNGVAALHTDLMRGGIFADLHRTFPDRIVNKTNGITPRRWLQGANRPLSALITRHIGDRWVANLDELRGLVPLAEDAAFREEFRAVKRLNKEALGRYVDARLGVELDPDTLFDVQVKRIHEYKRQLLNVLHVITLYNRIRAGRAEDQPPRTVLLAGKAAPGYYMAKLIIRLIHDVARVINADPLVAGRLRLVFVPDYNVSVAEHIMPAADLSEQISTAGTEASGTGNMKLALNGALTIGTRDGANVEIGDEVGEENIFFFGLSAERANAMRTRGGHDPWQYYTGDPDLHMVLDMIGQGAFSPDEPDRYRPIVDSLTRHGDYYLLLADYADYVACQERVGRAYQDADTWSRMAILNVARIGRFSSDVTVADYAADIWHVPVQTEPGRTG